MGSMNSATAPTNPVIRETALRAYPGWIISEYQDGTFVAADTRPGKIATSPVEVSFRDAVFFARHGYPTMQEA